MIDTNHAIHTKISFSSWMLTMAAFVFVTGMAASAPVRAGNLPNVPTLSPTATVSTAAVPIAQEPLTIRQPIAPNIVLMLDDSGSMMWDVMPDWGDLTSQNDLAVIDSTVNGVYYNPKVTYILPPKADGTSTWPDSDFSAAPVNGFDSASDRPVVDLTNYHGNYDNSVSTSRSNGYPSGGSKLQYSVGIPKAADIQDAYTAPSNCPGGTYNSGSQEDYCYYNYYPSSDFYEFYADVAGGTWYVSKCDKKGYIYNKKTDECLSSTAVTIARYCPDDEASIGTTTVGYNDNRQICVAGWNFFTYSTSNGTGYTRHYVGKNGDCAAAGLSADVCIDPSQTIPSDPSVQKGMSGADVLQNVANWFSYYHTRILMAKTGLMRAFSDLNPKYRFGFGSINGNAKEWVNDNVTDRYDFSTSTQSNNQLAEVKPFDMQPANASSTAVTRKAQFWDWIVAEHAEYGTPLRQSLNAVGNYYQTDQPWQNGQTEPLQCRQAYTILTTDGFWNGSGTDVKNEDGTSGDKITGPNNRPYTYTAQDPFTDDQSDTLADVAMKYWKTDLQTSLLNEVPTNASDPAFWQHMVTFTLGMGYIPRDAAGNKITKAVQQDLLTWSTTGKKPTSLTWGGWPEPSSDSINNISDMVHAAVDSHGGFYSATNPNTFVGALKKALQRATERTGSGSSVATSSARIKAGTLIFQSLYHTVIWTGDLKAYNFINKQIGSQLWDAAKEMPNAADRNIHTYKPGTGEVVFQLANLSQAEKDALGGDATTQANMVKYLRGDDSVNPDWRQRLETTLGDIIHSQPVYVGDVRANEFAGSVFDGYANDTTSTPFSDFLQATNPRAGRVYVAANDGMLHAFDSTTGKETFAYLPAAVITHGASTGGGISQLANPLYGTAAMPHQYFNDGQLTVAEAYFDATWHTILVGTTGRSNAKAVYALDVTDPGNIKLLWEKSAYTSGCDNCAYIGEMTGKPVIAQTGDGVWSVLIGNGYNSVENVAALLQFKLSDGSLTVHTTDNTTDNGLAAPAVPLSHFFGGPQDQIAVEAYAGDLHGRVWAFSLSQVTKKEKGNTTVYSVASTPSSKGAALFTAKDAKGNYQPITSGMLAAKDDNGNVWVFFGTGRYLDSADIDNTNVQSWYGLIVDTDGDPNSNSETLVQNLMSQGRAALAERDIILQTSRQVNPITHVVTPAMRVISGKDDPDTVSMNGKSGWYLDLYGPSGSASANGERIVGVSMFNGGMLNVTSIVPESDSLCDPTGTSWIYQVDPFTGTNPEQQLIDNNGDGVIDKNDMVKSGDNYLASGGTGNDEMLNNTNYVHGYLFSNSKTGKLSQKKYFGGGGALKRVSWREIVNP